MTNRPTLEFFFDYSSPFSYLAATQVEALCARSGATLVWRPFLLGGLFQAIGAPMVPVLEFSEPKRRHALADAYRWADHWGVPFAWPSRFPMRTILPLRVALAAGDLHVPFTHATFRAYWSADRDIADESVVREIAASTGLPPETFAKASSPPVKDALKKNGEEAAARGACGAPSFFVRHPSHGDDLYFWGQDRLGLVEKALGGWRPRSG